MQGATIESVYWLYGVKNVINLYTKWGQIENKTWTKITQKTIQNAHFTHLICLIYPSKPCHFCIWICWATHTPWKLTETYSGSHITQPIQHITLCCQEPWPIQVPGAKNCTTRTHNTNTYTQEVCISHLIYCVSTFWKCDYSTSGPKCNRPPKYTLLACSVKPITQYI